MLQLFIKRNSYNLWRFVSVSILSFVCAVTFAIPAKPGLTRQLTLADGTTISARLVGDEFCHYWLGQDGKAYQSTGDENMYQAVDIQAAQKIGNAKRNAANQHRAKRLMPKKAGAAGGYYGNKKGIIILVNFKDVAFKATQQDYDEIANTKDFSKGDFKGSMYDYFYAQSEGQFELTFDVVGPYTVSKNRSYYGQNDSQGNDKYAAEMVIEALKLADADVNFANYDWSGDGTVDQVYVVYAGQGEANGGSTNTIWPHAYTLTEAHYYGDGTGKQMLDNVYIDTYACGSELNDKKKTDGIGTMCHEFSHCLGYPDFYDIDYSGGQGMGYWDILDSGCYNGDGYRPAGYTAYERWIAGWREPIELTEAQQVEGMKALQDGGESYIIYNKGNRNEYFILENRQFIGWDDELPGKGLLIVHTDYNASAWVNNQPNDDPNHQRMTWIAADNKYQYEMYNGTKYYTLGGMATDTYPYGNVNAFGRSTTPAAKLYNKNADGTYYLDTSVEDITQNADGTISFRFVTPSDIVTPTYSNTFKLVESTSNLVSGMRYIIACGSKAKAAGSPNSSYLSAVDVTVNDDTITINDDVAVFLVEGNNDNGWSFLNENTNEYLYSNKAKSVLYTNNGPEYWELVDGTAGVVMEAYDSEKNSTMLYNASNPRFTTYTSNPTASMIQANLYMECDGTTPDTPDDPDPDTPVDPIDPDDPDNPVDPDDPVDPVPTVCYEQVFDDVTLTQGDEVLIAYVDEAGSTLVMGKTQNTNNRSAVTATMNDDMTLTPDDNAQVIVLEKENGTFLFNVGNGYLYAASSTANWLRTEETADDNAKADISINAEGNATIAFKGTNTRHLLRFNPNNGKPIFSCYTETSSVKALPRIYRKVTGEEIDPDNPTTGIDIVTSTKTSGHCIYTIDGRRVNTTGRLAHGLYIIDGRKYVK